MAAPDTMQADGTKSSATLDHSHRLPTITASQAFKSSSATIEKRAIRTSLPQLDRLISAPRSIRAQCSRDTAPRGFARGSITEIWGPPGSGTTALILQTATTVMANGGNVIWIDASTPLVTLRMKHILGRLSHNEVGNFRHIFVATLSHLLALVLRPVSSLPFRSADLLIIDGLNACIDTAYPRYTSAKATRTEASRWAASRRQSILGTLITSLQKLAAVNDLAVLVTTGCATQTRPDTGLGAVLVPGIGGAEWDSGISTRLVLFRDLVSVSTKSHPDGTPSAKKEIAMYESIEQQQARANAEAENNAERNASEKCSSCIARYIGVQKLRGTRLAVTDGVGKHLLPVIVDEKGVRQVTHEIRPSTDAQLQSGVYQDGVVTMPRVSGQASQAVSHIDRPEADVQVASKRKLDQVDDSDDDNEFLLPVLDGDALQADSIVIEDVIDNDETLIAET